MTKNERRASARDQIIETLEQRFYDFLAELAAQVETGDLDHELTQGTTIGCQLFAEPEFGGWMPQ